MPWRTVAHANVAKLVNRATKGGVAHGIVNGKRVAVGARQAVDVVQRLHRLFFRELFLAPGRPEGRLQKCLRSMHQFRGTLAGSGD